MPGKIFRGKDFIGKKAGKLEIVDAYRGIGVSWATCTCDCDPTKFHTIRLHDILSNKRKSCGCIKRTKESVFLELHQTEVKTAESKLWSTLLHRYKSGAKVRDISFELTYDQFQTFLKSPCHYCGEFNKGQSGIQVEQLAKRKRLKLLEEWQNLAIDLTGIDRVDSKKGYTTENCVSCCSVCNQIKMDLSQDEFLEKVKKIYGRHF